jgi:hypothetical protein
LGGLGRFERDFRGTGLSRRRNPAESLAKVSNRCSDLLNDENRKAKTRSSQELRILH